MKRHLLLFAVVGLLSTPLAAEELLIRFADLADPAPAPVLNPAAERADRAEDWKVSFETSFEEALNDEPLPLGEPSPTSSNECDFHSVCDCGCRIPPLGNWCDCYGSCCTTGCWVDYPCQCSKGNCYLTENGCWVSDDAFCDVSGTPIYRSKSALRFGWWGVDTDGSLTKIGEYQDLEPSPFWDVDAISSDGVRTWDIAMSGLDNEANDARLRYYGPEASAKVNYQRYLRRLDHDPVMGLDLAPGQVPPATPEGNVIADDLNVGDDYAIRIQELDARFKGRLTDNLKWRLNLWGQRKFGERQTNATAHCFNVIAPTPAGATGNTCHVVSQGQSIDWLTMEVQPVIEAEFENVTVEYSRTMRTFSQDDGTVNRMYTRFGFNAPAASGFLGPDYNYAIVPENVTQIDKLKVGAQLTEDNQFYANVYLGDTKNTFRDTHRDFSGFDYRLMNSSFDDLELTAYASMYDENSELPPFFLNAPPLSPTTVPPATSSYDELSLRHPVDYSRTRAGLKGVWQPFGDRRSCYPSYGLRDGTSLTGGYEYYQLERDFATYNTLLGPFTQPDTITHQIEFGPSTRWSRRLDTYTRYKVRFIDVPLIGVREYNGGFNTNQPEQEHVVEVGGTWTPTENFMATTQFSLVNSWHRSEFANFTEDSYPIVCTLWYAPTHRLSLTGGYAYYSNWIDQDITLGFTTPTAPVPPLRTETTRWDYAGENHLVSLNASYAWTECVQLVGGYEWNRGNNAFSVPASPAGADWTLLPFLSDVIVETNRVTAGVDWQPYQNMDVYLRYILFDYDDLSAGLDSGISHMALAGAGVNW